MVSGAVRSAARRAWIAALTGLLVTVALLPAAALAQGFGKNKVQYETLDWAVLETPHLRLHYYAEEESLARHLTAFAESVCVEFDGRFRLAPRKRVPLLLYAHHHLFQQTNASQGLISEGTGGLTELIKGRVLIPHNGSWARLRWVTRHELAHWYMLDKLGTVIRQHRRTQVTLPPLWFIEGFAEYCGTEWDEDAEGLLRDAFVTGQAPPLTRSEAITGTVLMYKEGQSFLIRLGERFGREKIFDLLDNWWRAEDFETAFRITFGERVEQADEEWYEHMRARYYPAVASAQSPDEAGVRLTRRGRYNLGPRVLPASAPGDTAVRFCYFAAGETGIDLMLSEPGVERRRERRLLRGGQSPQFESFHLFQNRPDASPSGRIVLSSKRGGRDAIYVVDSRNGRIERRFDPPGLVAINDPSLAHDDRFVVFSAMDFHGRADLYRVTWTEPRPTFERLTNDEFDDIEPDVSPDGRFVVFASDRADLGGRFALFRLSLESGAIEPFGVAASGDDRQPVFSPDGRWLAFRSTRGGTSDLWVRTAEPDRFARRVTRLLGPASDPDWLPGAGGLLFTAQRAVQFQTWRVTFDPDSLAPEPDGESAREPVLPAVAHDGTPQRYRRQLGIDFIQNAVAYDPGLGASGGGGQMALSDVLGNEQIHILVSNDSERFGSFWDGFELGATYLNQGRRLNYGVGAFRLAEIYDEDLGLFRLERRVGMLALASYPFDKFTRIETSVFARHAQNHLLRNGRFQTVDLVSNYLGVTHDNARWTMLGPSLGTRANVTGGFTRDLTSGDGDFWSLTADVRAYRMPLPFLVSATRVQGQSSIGQDAQRYYLGGARMLRGWDRRTLSGTQTLLVQQELRFPVLSGLTFAVPTTWEFPTVSAAAFADAAWGWEEDEPEQRKGGLGVGVFVGGGYFPALRWNFTWPTRDWRHFSSGPRTQFALDFNY